MDCSRISHGQLKAFSDCLHEIYSGTPGENPVEGVLDAIDRMICVDTLAADEMKGDGTQRGNGTHLVKHTHITSRHYEGHPLVSKMPLLCAHDHPMIRHVLKHGHEPVMKISDFVSERQMRNISLYEFNNRIHKWRDQAAVVIPVSGGSLSIALNRGRIFTKDELFMLRLLQPHIQRVINRCALFKRIPGNEQLTAREREVLYWIMQGKRDEEIAAIVQAAPRTVNKHVSAVLGKLGVENRAAAITMVLAEKE